MSKIVYIYTDGACSGNPGPGGWAALLKYNTMPDNTVEKLIAGGEANTTNNRMELTAAIEGLLLLKRRCKIILVTDSKYVQQGITSWIINWRKKGWLDDINNNNKIKNIDLWQKLDKLNKQHDITWEWVKGHSGHIENERVDKAARLEVEKFKNNNK